MGRMGGSGLPPEVFRYSGMGCIMAGGTLLFTAGGWAVDRLVGTLPVLTIIGALAGVGLSSLSVWRRLNPSEGAKNERAHTRNSRTKLENH